MSGGPSGVHAVLLGLALSLSGCVSLVDRTPNTGLVAELGPRAARRELMQVSRRTQTPLITGIEFIETGFIYIYSTHSPLMLIPVQARTSVPWDHLARLDLYENNKVFLIGGNDRELSWIQFSNYPDAERWVDLVLSLQHDYLHDPRAIEDE